MVGLGRLPVLKRLYLCGEKSSSISAVMETHGSAAKMRRIEIPGSQASGPPDGSGPRAGPNRRDKLSQGVISASVTSQWPPQKGLS